jgi:hypothetical protein
MYCSQEAVKGNGSRVIGFEEDISPIPKQWLLARVKAFYLVCKLERQRTEIVYHLGELRLLIFMSDASQTLGALQCYLVTGLTINGIYSGKANLLDQKYYLNLPDETFIPFLDLRYLHRNPAKNLFLLPWLASQGLSINSKTMSSSLMTRLHTFCNCFGCSSINIPCKLTTCGPGFKAYSFLMS